MANFSPKNKKDDSDSKLILILNIGSSSVGGAVLSVSKTGSSKSPRMIFNTRESIAMQAKVDEAGLLSAMIKCLDTVLDKIYRKKLGRPEEFYCVLSSPWYSSHVRIIKLTKSTPFVFTSSLADDLIKKEVSLFKKEVLKEEGAKPSVRLLEFKNIKTVLDGDETPRPLNKRAHELEMSVFVSVSEEYILTKIEEAVGRHFHCEHLQFSSFALASFALLRDMYDHQKDFLVLDISGEMTEVSLVDDNVLRASISFPLGANSFIRGVANSISHPLHLAKSTFFLVKNEHASHILVKKLESTIKNLKKVWLHKFQESLIHLRGGGSLPTNIFLFSDKASANYFLDLVSEEQFHQYSAAESKFDIVLLDSATFHGMVDFEKDLARDVGLTIHSIYISRFLQ